MLLKSVLMGFLSFHSADTPILKECKTEADKISGCVEKEYDSNGKIYWEAPYKNGKAEGIAKWYYENGNLNIETPYKNDKRDGMTKWYYDNGNLMAEIPHLNDLLHGDMTYYTEDKKLLALVKAENGSITSGKCFNDKVLTDKEIDEININDIEKAIISLKEICLKSDSK